MSSIKPQTLKGFRDFLPKEAKKRQYVIETLRKVFESYGFEPLETPALEYEEVLLGKYGEEGDKLIYRFTDRGGRKVALRYDQTVPLARVVAQYGSASSPQVLPMPFKRYQIQPVWRAENPQKGRFREFLQCDADIVGTNSPLADAEVIAVAAKGLEALGFQKYEILINDREIFSQIKEQGFVKDEDLMTVLRMIDKIKKVGEDAVKEELQEKGFSKETAGAILDNAKTMKQNDRLIKILAALKQMGIPENSSVFSPTLARGLDYYTSTIFEIEVEGYNAGSVCGGGRYDKLIGMFLGKDIPAVGFSFGFDRLVEAMDKLNLFPTQLSQTMVLVTIFSKDYVDRSVQTVSVLRANGINAELYIDETTPLEKQLKYADQKQIPYTIIIGPKEAAKKTVILRNMKTREQREIPEGNLPYALRS